MNKASWAKVKAAIGAKRVPAPAHVILNRARVTVHFKSSAVPGRLEPDFVCHMRALLTHKIVCDSWVRPYSARGYEGLPYSAPSCGGATKGKGK